MYVCMWVHYVFMPWCTCGGHRTISGALIIFSLIWDRVSLLLSYIARIAGLSTSEILSTSPPHHCRSSNSAVMLQQRAFRISRNANFGLHAFLANILLTKPSPQPPSTVISSLPCAALRIVIPVFRIDSSHYFLSESQKDKAHPYKYAVAHMPSMQSFDKC